ncbi:MAG: hypothetical protein ACKVZH_13575 [Blastocatellia bacterium]
MLLFVCAMFLGLTPVNDPVVAPAQNGREAIEYKLLATNKTSSMEREMNAVSAEGYRFEGTMGGETANGGNEIVVIMSRRASSSSERLQYKLLATNKTSTMQKELTEAGANGFSYVGQSVYSSTFGGKEVIVILERNDKVKTTYEYKLQATTRTSTMQKELNAVGGDGFQFCGITVAETAFGGKEVVSIMRRVR